MHIIKPSVKLIDPPTYEAALKKIERCGRVCYKSEENITDGSAERFVKNLIERGHESVLEHVSITAMIVCDRGISHELVRHRIASYSQESTRYCNYANGKFDGEITVIEPYFLKDREPAYTIWLEACKKAEAAYLKLLNRGCTPQEARTVLPNSLKTEIAVTMNIREWRHFFRLRCARDAHPQMQEIAGMLLDEMKEKYEIFVNDLS